MFGKSAHMNMDGGIGHKLPLEAPKALADAIIDAARFRADTARA
jgi:hypothetical protein